MAENSVNKVIDTYQKRWNIKDKKNFDMNTDQFVPSNLKEGEEYTDKSKNVRYTRKNGKLIKQSASFIDKDESHSSAVCKCGKKIKNPNEHNVFLQTGKCYTCHAVEEKERLSQGKPPEPKEWDKEVFFVDDKGNAVMNEKDFLAHHGEKKAFILLDNILEQFSNWENAGKYVNPYRKNLVKKFHERVYHMVKDDFSEMIEQVKEKRSASDAQVFINRINEIKDEYDPK